MERREGSRVLVATSSSNTRVLVAIGSRVLVATSSMVVGIKKNSHDKTESFKASLRLAMVVCLKVML